MPEPLLEDVFKLSGIPTHTFVKPVEYERLLVALRTLGRGVVIEGPSGIGKTTAVTRALDELGLADRALKLSARVPDDRSLITELPTMNNVGIVIVDDFHRLETDVRERVADYLKTLADQEATGSKLVVVGINQAGDSLVSFARDLATRLDVIRFEANPDDRVAELVSKGEAALNIDIGVRDEIAEASSGSFYIAQMFCHQTCLMEGIFEAQTEKQVLEVSFETVRTRVVADLDRSYREVAREFAAGPRLRREGRAPYLHILRWLAEANEWSISLEREMTRHPDLKGKRESDCREGVP
jgi:hypothetical protein